MELTHIEHLGIAVKSIEACLPYYEEVLGLKCYNIEEVADQKVKTARYPPHCICCSRRTGSIGRSRIKRYQADRQSSSWRCRRLEHCIPSPEIDMQRSDRTLHAGKIRNN